MTFEQWWERNGVGHSSYEDFAREIWVAAQQNGDAPIISIGDGASVDGLIVIQPQKEAA